MEIATRRREQEVWQACDDLWALHGDLKTLTGDAIRDRLVTLGKSRGSPNEIYKYRRSWGESRGVSAESGPQLIRDEDDPITRAVRLVHEKLQQETREEIESIHKEYEAKLLEKDNNLAQQKADLALMMEEFSKAQNECTRLQKALSENSLELEAEIAVRQALERELLGLKKDHQQALFLHNQILAETKNAHLESLAVIKEMTDKERASLLARVEKLESEKKELGHQFSEQLNEIRTREYNLSLLNNSLSKNFEEQKTITSEQKEVIAQQKIKLTEVLETFNVLRAHEANAKSIITQHKEKLDQQDKKLAHLNYALKERELMIARLRATLMHQDKRWKS